MEEVTYHYEFNTKKLPPDLEQSKLDQCIYRIVHKEGYISCDVQKKTISTDGGNYLGQLYQINIKGQTENGNKETPVFVKAIPSDAIEMDFLSLDNVYTIELFAYRDLAKIFDELQDEAEVPSNERFQKAKSYDESYSKAIILENLTERGFRTWYRMDCVTLDMAEVCIKQLARFHSLSFVIKDRKPEYFENKIKSLDHPLIFKSKAWEDFTTKFTRYTLEHLEEDMRRKVEDKIPGILEKYPRYFLDDSSKSCVCHGDYKPNNVMIKEMNGKTIEAIPVDYQLIHYGCPVLDIFYFLYTGADFEFRWNHMSYLKDLYFKTLETYLKLFNLEVESVYPRKRFEREFEEKRDSGLTISVVYLPFMFAAEGKAPDLLKETVADLDIVVDERFKERIVGTFREFIELGYL